MQFEWILTLITSYAMVLALMVIVTLVIYGLLLGVALGFVGGKHKELGSTFVTALLVALVSWIPCLGCILSLYFIKSRHEIGWGSALIAWILMFIIAIVVIIVILMIAFPAIWLAMWGMFWP
jgi:hypothetical protein